MHIISRAPFDEAARRYPNEAQALTDIYKTLKRLRFTTPDEMRKVYAPLDRMKYRERWWVMDVGGNSLRIMFYADFESGRLFIKHIVSHASYDKLI
ncbi:type II toxin-antitoxin system HigB family toxin [Yokenella regensburgei]|uniref:type II toxin-antitoxin system HigB family toxin n=1 Tax=Yokenella regensburgei TaxID=158877 RepID=UPI003F1605F6